MNNAFLYPQDIHRQLSRNDYRLDDLFLSRGWRNVAVYGAGKLELFFCDALSGTDVNIRCIIDMDGQAESPAPHEESAVMATAEALPDFELIFAKHSAPALSILVRFSGTNRRVW